MSVTNIANRSSIRTTTTESLTATPLRDTYHLVRERVYQGSLDFVLILAGLQREKVTGTLIADISQGGLCRVRFREEQDIRYSSAHP